MWVLPRTAYLGPRKGDAKYKLGLWVTIEFFFIFYTVVVSGLEVGLGFHL